jgi:hypothetical protein
MNSASVLSWVHFYDKVRQRIVKKASKKGREEREREIEGER